MRVRAKRAAFVRAGSTFSVAAALAAGFAPQANAQVSDRHPDGYSLVFSDEFDGSSLDRSKWCTRYAYGGGPSLQVPDGQCTPNGMGTLDFLNDEQQRYRDYNAKNETLHVVGGGLLKLRATKTGSDSYAAYESAMIRSKQEFRPSSSVSYYLTTRVQLPDVIGTWPAFWLAPGFGSNNNPPWPPEIDIVDAAYNGQDDRIDMLHIGAIVQGAQTKNGQKDFTYVPSSFETTWGNYNGGRALRGIWVEIGAEWTASGVCYYVDDAKVMCENYKWVENGGATANPASVLLNFAVGGGWAGRYGIDDSKLPTSFDIDFVRVYSKGGGSPPPPPPPPPPPSSKSILIDAANAGNYTASDGRVWSADQYFTGGETVDRGNIGIAGTSDPQLFQTERWGMSAYTVPVANGTYDVKLYFAETNANLAHKGGRIFHINVEGRWLFNFDIFATAGSGNKAVVKTFSKVPVKDGKVDLKFIKRVDSPKIDAIEISPSAS